MDEIDFIPISALQHFMYCPRQCGLIHIERIWEENSATAEGKNFHQNVHFPKSNQNKDSLIANNLQIKSNRLGIVGETDIVEFHIVDNHKVIIPIEYKKGAPKNHLEADSVQLCAEAICLEEMLNIRILSGKLFYGEPHRRISIDFDPRLRAKTCEVARQVHLLISLGKIPPPIYSERCKGCSLKQPCLPNVSNKHNKKALEYLRSLWGNDT